ncbi:hypothetical protein RND81_03G046600 [Saponaria officinalis]|uniref:Uncharacterized protein n=1 Tax=Saponaria officinalis TaxID=3572 RepID=A0AAW1M5H2_SAPOF
MLSTLQHLGHVTLIHKQQHIFHTTQQQHDKTVAAAFLTSSFLNTSQEQIDCTSSIHRHTYSTKKVLKHRPVTQSVIATVQHEHNNTTGLKPTIQVYTHPHHTHISYFIH